MNIAELTKLPERIQKKVMPTPDGCWHWSGIPQAETGYSVVMVDRKRWYVHRLTYTLLVGPIPDGKVIDHLCRVRSCVNPDHLEPVTHGENIRRGTSHWRNQTHCIYGHPFDDENTRMYRGHRRCRACTKLNNDMYRRLRNGTRIFA